MGTERTLSLCQFITCTTTALMYSTPRIWRNMPIFSYNILDSGIQSPWTCIDDLKAKYLGILAYKSVKSRCRYGHVVVFSESAATCTANDCWCTWLDATFRKSFVSVRVLQRSVRVVFTCASKKSETTMLSVVCCSFDYTVGTGRCRW